MQKLHKKLPSAHHRTTLSGYIFATKACFDNRKKSVKQQYLLHTLLIIWWTSAHEQQGSVLEFGTPQQISTVFASWLRYSYCTDVAQQRSTKLCMMFGRLLGCYTMYTFLEALSL